MEFRSNEIMHDEDSPFHCSLFRSMGYSDHRLDYKLLIGIVNTWNTCVPGHSNLNQVNELVKKGICSADGTVVEFNTTGCCGGAAQGHIGMNYTLPPRGIICNSVEVMVQVHRLDGIVLLAPCDKIAPGMLMVAACLDIPVTVYVGGPMLGGIELDGRKPNLTSIDEAKGMTRSGKITEDEYHPLENTACSGRGPCLFSRTANSTCCVSETMRMSLSGGALIPAPYEERPKSSSEAGRAVVNPVVNNIIAKQVITKESMRNATKVTMAICGPINAVLHIVAIANEAKLDMNVVEELRTLNFTTPQITRVNPAAKQDMEASRRAGGIPRMMGHLGSTIDRSAVTCTGKSVDENLKDQVYWYPENRKIIRTVDESFSRVGGVAILSENLIPDMAISKLGVIDPALHRLTGKAGCYNSEEEAELATLSGEIQRGEVAVICYEGPKGGPDMKEVFKAMKYMHGMGFAKDMALITDGRSSGTNNGRFVGHISPEVVEGGPLALVEDEDEIMIDVAEGKLELHASDEIISVRRKY